MVQNWVTVFQAMAAFYLIGGALVIDASKNWPSRFLFKVVPMALGFPLAVAVVAKINGWPL
jgi:hypothetical protein